MSNQNQKHRSATRGDETPEVVIGSYQLAVAQQDSSPTYEFDLMPAIFKANNENTPKVPTTRHT